MGRRDPVGLPVIAFVGEEKSRGAGFSSPVERPTRRKKPMGPEKKGVKIIDKKEVKGGWSRF